MNNKENIKGEAFVWCIVFPFINVAILALPLDLLTGLFVGEEHVKPVNTIIKAGLIISLTVYLSKTRLTNHSFLHPFRIASPYYLLIPLVYPLLPGVGNVIDLAPEFWNSLSFWLYFLSVFAAAFAEEFAFRGFLLHYLVQNRSPKKYLGAALVISGIFAVMHFINLRHLEVAEVGAQVIIAFCFGVFLSALIIKVRNIYVLGIIHGLVNFLYSARTRAFERSPVIHAPQSSEAPITGLLILFLLFLPLLLIGALILWKNRRAV